MFLVPFRFSLTADNQFFLNTYRSKGNLISRIRSTPYAGSFTNTAGGIRLALDDQFQPSVGDRPNAKNIMIVITDGASNIGSANTIPFAQEAVRRGIRVSRILK